MHLISPFDLLAMFPPGGSLAIVGNAPSLTGAALGELIDSHDVVVRFNACALRGFEQDTGRRTDILVSNPYPEERERPPLDGYAARLLLIVNPQTRRGDAEAFARWAGELPVLFTYTPGFPGLDAVDFSMPLTTGTQAIHLLCRLLQPARVLCTGFTLFLDETAHHYWQDQPPPGLSRHDPLREAQLFVRVVNRIRADAVEVTAEIDWVARRIGKALRRGIRVRDLPDPRWTAR